MTDDATPPVSAAPVVPPKPSLAVGTRVRYWPGLRRGEGKIGTTLSEREVLGGHTAGYFVRKSNGGSDFISESHVEAATPDDAGSPVVPAATDEPACSTCNDTKTVVKYVGGNDVGYTYDAVCQDCPDPSAPAATDEPALTGVCAICSSNVYHDGGHFPQPPGSDDWSPAGYVLLPRKELDGLLSAALDVIVVSKNNPSLERLAGAHHDVEAAVVEAVGPTT